MLRPTLLLAFLLLSAGCSGVKHDASSTPTNLTSVTATGPSSSSSSQPSPPGANATALNVIEGSKCQALGSTFTWPGTVGPGTAPQGWDPGTVVASSVYTFASTCSRIHAGPLERSVNFILEGHDKANAPTKCREGKYDTIQVLNAIWVNDTATASFLRSTYHMPVVLGTITSTATARIPPLTSYEWSWREANATKVSSLSMNATNMGGQTIVQVVRLAWSNGQGISYADWTDTFRLTNEDDAIQTGHMEAPMLYAQNTPNPYVGRGQMFYDDSFQAQVHAFKDYACEQPL